MRLIPATLLAVLTLLALGAISALPAEAMGYNRCQNYPCGCCCSQDTVPCCDPRGAPAFVRAGTEELARKIATQRLRVWRPQDTHAFLAHFERNASHYAIGAPSYHSAFAIGGTGDTEIFGSAMDSSGNVIVAGAFIGNIVFPTTPAPTTVVSRSDADVFFAKFTPGGHCLWARVAHGDATVPAGLALSASLAIAVDSSNNTYLGGGFVRSLTFLDAAGHNAAQVTASGTNLNFDAFLVKYDTNGNLLWARGGQSGAEGDPDTLDFDINAVTSIVVDATGNLFTAGSISAPNFLGAAVDYIPDAAFVARIDPATGLPVWVRITESDGFDGTSDLAPDGQGGAFALFWSDGGVMEYPTSPTPTDIYFDPSSDPSFLTHWDANGNCLWAKQPASFAEVAVGVGLGVSPAGELYLSGAAQGYAFFDALSAPGLASMNDQPEGFLAKYSAQGTALWVRTQLSADGSIGDRLTVDSAGNAYMIGEYYGNLTLTGNTASAGLNIASGLDLDIFLAQYDATGTPRWLRSLASPGKANAGYTASDSVPVSLDSASMYYHPATQSVMTTGDFVGALVLDSDRQLTAADNSRYSFAAILPAANAQANPLSPTLRITTAGSGWAAPDTFYVDLLVTNTGFGNALSPQMTAASAKMVFGSGTVTYVSPALPDAFTAVAPSASTTLRLYCRLSQPAGTHRLSLATGFTTESIAGTRLSTAYSTTVVATQ